MTPEAEEAATRWPSVSPAMALVLASTMLVQGTVLLARVGTSYRAIDLGLSVEWLGLLSSAFALLPVLLALATGRMVDRRGERPAFVLGSMLLIAATALLWLASATLAGLLVGLALLGQGGLCLMVGQQSLVARLVPPQQRDAAFGHYTIAVSFGQVVGPLVLNALAGGAVVPETTRIFAAAGILACLTALVSLLIRPPAGGAGSAAAAGKPVSLLALLRVPGISLSILAGLMVLTAVELLIVYLPAFGAERGIDAGTIGTLLSLRAIASLLSRVWLGQLVALAGRRILLSFSIAAAATGLVLLPVPMPVVGMGALVVVIGLGIGLCLPLTMAWLADVTPAGTRATALSVRLSGNRLGQAVLPLGLGSIAGGVGAAGVLVGMAVALAITSLLTAYATQTKKE
jgi:MFS family permease